MRLRTKHTYRFWHPLTCPSLRSRWRHRRPGEHPAHPRCSACGGAVYKSLPGQSHKTKPWHPWRWCRNRACFLFGWDLTRRLEVRNYPWWPTVAGYCDDGPGIAAFHLVSDSRWPKGPKKIRTEAAYQRGLRRCALAAAVREIRL